MQILILGAGAIGAYLGASLGRSGQWVTLVGRKPFVDAVNRDGLQMQLPDGDSWQTSNFRAVTSLVEAGISQGMYVPPYDVIITCVKAYDVDEAIREVRANEQALYRAGKGGTIFVSFQNGVGSEDRFAQAFGAECVWAGTTTSPVTVPQAGQVRVERAGGTICLAPLGREDETGAQMVEHVREAFWTTRVYPDARALKWSKLLLNMMGNATSAILGMPPADIYAEPALYRFEIRALREAILVMQREHIQPVNLPHYPAAMLAKAIRWLPSALMQPILRNQLARGRGGKWPSFYYDVQNRTGHSEVAWLNGAVVDYGRRLGLPTPVNQRLTEVLVRIIRGEDDPSIWRGQVERLVTLQE